MTALRWDTERGVRARSRIVGVAIWMAIAAAAAMAAAADWGTITPGTSTMESVRARYGAATRTANLKVEGYDTVQWTYEEPQAPTGMKRMIVDFGLLGPAGYRRDLVRTLRLEPHPGVFDRTSVINGWGRPTRVGDQGGSPVFFYEAGLLVYFDHEGWIAQSLLFTPPQPHTPDKPAPAR